MNNRNIVLRSISLGALVASLAGCATVPNLGEAPTVRSANQLATARSIQAEVIGQWPTDEWWRGYNDPQLDALIEAGLSGSPDLAIASARLRAANAAAGGARAATLPRVTAQGSAAAAQQSSNNGIPAEFVPQGLNDTASVSVGLSFDLDLWGGNRAAVRAAVSEAEAAALEIDQANLVLATGIAQAYATLVELNAHRLIAVDNVRMREEVVGLVEQRVTHGLDTNAELSLAQAALPEARGELLAIEESMVVVRHQIAALLGEGPDLGLEIEIGVNPPAIHSLPSGVTTDLVSRRPDIRAAMARVAAADSRIDVAHAAFYPSVNIAALIGFQALGLGNVFASGSGFGSAGPAVSLPIFDGGGIASRYTQSRAGYDEAVAIYDRTVVGAFREVADAVAARQSLVGRLAEAKAAHAAAELGYATARQRFEGRLSTYLDVLAAERAVLTSRRTVAELSTRGFMLDVALVRALGGGFVSASSTQITQ